MLACFAFLETLGVFRTDWKQGKYGSILQKLPRYEMYIQSDLLTGGRIEVSCYQTTLMTRWILMTAYYPLRHSREASLCSKSLETRIEWSVMIITHPRTPCALPGCLSMTLKQGCMLVFWVPKASRIKETF